LNPHSVQAQSTVDPQENPIPFAAGWNKPNDLSRRRGRFFMGKNTVVNGNITES
jgi:hypothetical protein